MTGGGCSLKLFDADEMADADDCSFAELARRTGKFNKGDVWLLFRWLKLERVCGVFDSNSH